MNIPDEEQYLALSYQKQIGDLLLFCLNGKEKSMVNTYYKAYRKKCGIQACLQIQKNHTMYVLSRNKLLRKILGKNHSKV